MIAIRKRQTAVLSGASVRTAIMSFRFTQIVNQKMTGAKKILITTESHEKFILRFPGGGRAFGTCPACGREAEMLTIDQTVSLSGIKTGELVRRAEAGDVHSLETGSGHLLFCKDSVVKAAKR